TRNLTRASDLESNFETRLEPWCHRNTRSSRGKRDWPEMTFEEVKEQFLVSVSEASGYQSWMTELDDARYGRWNGQTNDGRKYSKYTGSEVFPWEGASDMRPFFIDDIVNDDVDVMRMADKNCHMQTVPVNSTFQQQATSQTAVLDYVARAMMAEELEQEKELLAQWRQHFGSSVMAVDWYMDVDSEVVTVTLQDLQMLAQQIPELGDMLAYMLSNRGQLSQTDIQQGLAFFQQIFPQVTNPMQALSQLMQTGQFQYDSPYIKESRPCVTALRTFQDVFFLRGAYNLQLLPWIVRRDVIPKATVEDRAQYEKWDPKFTKQILNSAGSSVLGFRNTDNLFRYSGNRIYVDQMKEMCEVFYGFYRGQHSHNKRRIQVTIFPPVTDVIGRQLPNPYNHGK